MYIECARHRSSFTSLVWARITEVDTQLTSPVCKSTMIASLSSQLFDPTNFRETRALGGPMHNYN